MKSLVQVLTLGCIVALGSFAVTGCSSKSAAPDKMSTDNMSSDKMGEHKMGMDKMGNDKMTDGKMTSEMAAEKMK